MTSALRPSILIPAAILALLTALLVGPVTGEAQAGCKYSSTPAFEIKRKQARKATLCLINKQRRSRGLSRLREQKAQRKAAKKHTKNMLKRGCFGHKCPGEGDLVDRITATRYLPCGCSWGVAENIAYGYGIESSPKRIVRAWMRSSGHRANILNRSYEHIGIGIRPGSPSGRRNAATYTTTFGYRD